MEPNTEITWKIVENEREVGRNFNDDRCARFGRVSYEGPWQIATFLLPKRHSTVFMVMVMVAAAGSLNLKGHGGWWREGEDEGP